MRPVLPCLETGMDKGKRKGRKGLSSPALSCKAGSRVPRSARATDWAAGAWGRRFHGLCLAWVSTSPE